MALTATIYHFQITLSDVDRGVYESLDLRVARHPSETMRYLVTRTLAYCLSYEDGIAFSEGLSSTDEPAVVVRDRPGRTPAWIEVGAPDAERLHYGSRLAERTVVYTHRDPAKVMGPWEGKRIHRAEDLRVYSFDPGFIDSAGPLLERRNTAAMAIKKDMLYLDLDGTTLTTAVHEHAPGS